MKSARSKYYFISLLVFMFIFSMESKMMGAGDHFLESVDENARLQHAKELLGKNGFNRVSKNKGINTNQTILQLIKRELKPKWQGKARPIAQAIIHESRVHNFDPFFVTAIIKTESQFDPLTKGSHGEIGLMQIKPDTAMWIAKKYNLPWSGSKTLENPSLNIKISLFYMKYLQQKFQGKAHRYVAAYNVGPKKFQTLESNNATPKVYSMKVMKNYKNFYASSM